MTGTVAYASLPFGEQIAFFRAKKLVTTERYTDVWQEEHDHALMVAGANRIDLLTELHAAIDKAIAQGTGLEAFRRDWDRITAGWDYTGGRNWRSLLVYDTNLRQSYHAGRDAQWRQIKQFRPYKRYRHMDGQAHPRPEHQAWDGLVLDGDHPFWKTHTPQNAYFCKCRLDYLSERDLKRLGKSGPDEAPTIQWRDVLVGKTGPNPTIVRTPVGVDPGFAYQPGASAYAPVAQSLLDKAAKLPAAPSAAAVEPILGLKGARAALDAGFRQWVDDVVADPVPRGRTVAVGALSTDTVTWLQRQSIDPATASIFMRDADLLHATRSAKVAALPPDVLRAIPRALRDRQAVLYDVDNQTLLYVFDTGDDAGKLVVRVNYRFKGAPPGERINLVRTGSIIDTRTLRGAIQGGKMIVVEGGL